MRVGAFSGVVPDALEFAFEVLKHDTPAETATLEMEVIPLRIYCQRGSGVYGRRLFDALYRVRRLRYRNPTGPGTGDRVRRAFGDGSQPPDVR